MPLDVPSPIDFKKLEDARAWELNAPNRFGRKDIMQTIADFVIAHNEAGAKILELGAGPAHLAKLIVPHIKNSEYHLLDSSPAMHTLAAENLGEFATKVSYLYGDFTIENWQEKLETYNFIITNQAIHEVRHITKVPAVHKAVKKILQSGGYYLIADHFYGAEGLQNPELYMTQENQENAIKDAGFDNVKKLLVKGSLVLFLAW